MHWAAAAASVVVVGGDCVGGICHRGEATQQLILAKVTCAERIRSRRLVQLDHDRVALTTENLQSLHAVWLNVTSVDRVHPQVVMIQRNHGGQNGDGADEEEACPLVVRIHAKVVGGVVCGLAAYNLLRNSAGVELSGTLGEFIEWSTAIGSEPLAGERSTRSVQRLEGRRQGRLLFLSRQTLDGTDSIEQETLGAIDVHIGLIFNVHELVGCDMLPVGEHDEVRIVLGAQQGIERRGVTRHGVERSILRASGADVDGSEESIADLGLIVSMVPGHGQRASSSKEDQQQQQQQ